MHRWLLLLMIALLPLRGWVGDAMAGEMIAQQMGGAQQATSHARAMHVAAQPPHERDHQGRDCMEHAQTPSGDSGATKGERQGEVSPCSTCASCQACSSPALTLGVETGSTRGFAPPRPPSAAARFASADPAPGLKPPIS
jgi:hypothetical protein